MKNINDDQVITVDATAISSNVPARFSGSLAPANGYVSAFDDPDRFEHLYRMAEILSNSLFVPGSGRPNDPASFRGNPANCLLALDLAGRLGLAPTALFPHLYVINGRPALSSQFVIALVNRSGAFSRISWEEGTDGETTYEAYGRQRTSPNYYAVAKFTELKSGIEYRSTRVSLELAKRSGWLTKNESKWQSMPREMCRWRSAAWLAKNYAPELVLGFEFEEEVRDYDARPAIDVAPRVRVARPEPDEKVASELDDKEAAIRNALEGARSLEELNAVARSVGRADELDGDAKRRLRDVYRARRDALDAPPVDVEVVAPEPVEEAPKPKRARKAKSQDAAPESAPSVDDSAIVAAIRDAKNLDELAAVRERVEKLAQDGAISESELDSFLSFVQSREISFEEEPAADPEPTERQKRNADGLREGIATARDLDEIEKNVAFVQDALDRDLITEAQYADLESYAHDRAKGFLV